MAEGRGQRLHLRTRSQHRMDTSDVDSQNGEPFIFVDHLPKTKELVDKLLDIHSFVQQSKDELDTYISRTSTEPTQRNSDHTNLSLKPREELCKCVRDKTRAVEELEQKYKEVGTTLSEAYEEVGRYEKLWNESERKVQDLADKLTKQTNANKYEMDHYSKTAKAAISSITDAFTNEKQLREKAERKVEELEIQISQNEKEIAEYKANQGAHSPAYHLHASEKMEITKLKAELEETKTRLSKMMGTKLSDNNPNITDLSDRNRPSKLGERFQELYDNQWTDAYEIVEKYSPGDEKECVGVLLKILLAVQKVCDKEAKQYEANMNDALFVTEDVYARTRKKPKPVPDFVNKALKDCRKALAIENVDNIHQIFLRNTSTQSTRGKLTHTLKSYVRECVELCWLMALQDPPVVFGPNVGRGTSFDTNVFRPYTISGSKIEFVVWPPIYLHEGGPILGKGVAQGYKSGTDRVKSPPSNEYHTEDKYTYSDKEKKTKRQQETTMIRDTGSDKQHRVHGENKDTERFRPPEGTFDKDERSSRGSSHQRTQLATGTQSLSTHEPHYAVEYGSHADSNRPSNEFQYAGSNISSTHYAKGKYNRPDNRQTNVPTSVVARHQPRQAWIEGCPQPSPTDLDTYEYYLKSYGEAFTRKCMGDKFDMCRRYKLLYESHA